MVRTHQVLACFMAIVVALFIASEVDSYPYRDICYCRQPPRRGKRIFNCRLTCHRIRESSSDIYRKLALCSILDAQREVRCLRFSFDDEWLRRRGESWQMPLKNDSFVSAVGIEVDEAGNAFVAMIDSQRLRYLIFNLDNELLADLDRGKVDKKYGRHEVDGTRLGDEFCLTEVGDSEADGQADRRVVNECIDMWKYVNATG